VRPVAWSAALLSALATVSLAHASPQWNGALRPGIAGVGTRSEPWQSTQFHGALYGDVLLNRASSNDAGVGPFLQLATAGFSDLRLAGGPTLLLPLGSWVTQLGAGAYWVPTTPSGQGLHAQLFFGGRGYNYHAAYSPALGVVLGLDYALDRRHEVVLSAALSVDLQYLALPFLILYGSLQASD
jgi:hypothetical protein